MLTVQLWIVIALLLLISIIVSDDTMSGGEQLAGTVFGMGFLLAVVYGVRGLLGYGWLQ